MLQLYYVEELNLEEIGQVLDVGAARICQIKKAALGKLRARAGDLEGAEVVGLYPFGPLVEGTGVNITVFSNAGRMNVGVITCPELLPRPGTVLADLRRGMDELLAAIELAPKGTT